MRRSWKHSPRLSALPSSSRSRSVRTSASSSTAPRRDTPTTYLSDLFPTFCSKALRRFLQPARPPRSPHCRSESRSDRNAQLFVEVTARIDFLIFQRFVPKLFGDFFNRRALPDPRIADQKVDPTEMLNCLLK